MSVSENKTVSHLLNYGIALFIILTINFALPRLMPGDPMSAMYGEEVLVEMSPGLRAEIEQNLGLSQALWKQFFMYAGSLLTGDLGYSFYHKRSVFSLISEHLRWTLLLSAAALVPAFLVGVLTGLESAWKRGSRWDRFLTALLMSVSGAPGFFIGILLLLLFSIRLGIFPAQGALTPYADLNGIPLYMDIFRHLVLPAATLAIAFTPGYFLLMRNSAISVIREPFILTALAKGLKPARVKFRHAGRNALIPVVTISGIHLGTRLITGALFVEIVFSYPGMGSLIYHAVRTRDYPVLQGALFILTVLILAVNLLIDAAYRYLDPRINHAH